MEQLDELDLKILRLLQQDASLATAELAERVGLSQAPCWRRIKRMKENGTLAAITARLNSKAVGWPINVIATVALEHHNPEDVKAFEQAVATAPEVLECHALSGDRDYWLKIVVRDIEDYDRILAQRLLRSRVVRSIDSRFVLRTLKATQALPI